MLSARTGHYCCLIAVPLKNEPDVPPSDSANTTVSLFWLTSPENASEPLVHPDVELEPLMVAVTAPVEETEYVPLVTVDWHVALLV